MASELSQEESRDIYQRTAALLCKTSKGWSSGTGLWLGHNLLLTAHHTLKDYQSIEYRWEGEITWRTINRILAEDAENDVVVLEVMPREFDVRCLPAWFYRPEIKKEAVIAGYPKAQKEDNALKLELIEAECPPLTGESDGKVKGLNAKNFPTANAKRWKGVSGAGFFIEGALVGVTIEAKPNGLVACTLEKLRAEKSPVWPLIAPHLTPRLPPGLTPNVTALKDTEDSQKNNPGTLLTARYQVVPFIPELRTEELTNLETWIAQNHNRTLRLFTGPGGIGKTRLFIHWTQELQKRGWTAAFVAKNEKLAPPDSASPRFVVVDYAETRTDEVLSLLEDNQPSFPEAKTPPLYVALLARSAGDWWVKLKDSTPLAENADVIALEVLQLESELRQVAFQKAADVFAERLKVSPIETTPPLKEPHHGHILYLLMEAYLATVQKDEPSPQSGRKALSEVLKHERNFWLPEELKNKKDNAYWRRLRETSRLVAALTLRGKTHASQLETLDLGVSGRKTDSESAANFREFLLSLYPHHETSEEEDYVAGIEPDLLGETLVAQTLWGPKEHTRDRPQNYLECVFADEEVETVAQGFTVLGRIELASSDDEDAQKAQKWFERLLEVNLPVHAEPALKAAIALGEKSAYSALGDILSKALEEEEEKKTLFEVASLFERMIPGETVALRALYAQVLKTQLASTEDEGERSRLLNNLGNRLSALGQREDALKATQEAVDIRRKLAEKRPDAFLPDLAMSLNNLGLGLSDLGQREDALKATQEAVDIRRKLAEKRPDAFLPDLALSLNNLGNRLSELGQREDALKATQEAVDIYRKLAEKRPDAFLPDLALSLNNLGNRLSELGQREDALKATQEAVDIYRKLAEKRPDAFLPQLALSLNNLGKMLSDLGQREDALKATQQAVDIQRKLAEKRPDAFLPDLAMSLNNLGKMLSELGQREDALKATQQAVDIYRKLAEKRPDAFLPDLAMSLNNLGNRLSALGQREDALKATQEAVDIRRKLAEKRPDAFLPDLAMSLNNLGLGLSDLGQREDALKATQEAVDIYRKLAEKRPDAFLPDLASSLTNLGKMLSELGQREDALKATQQAVDIYRKLAEKRPDAFLPDLASSLTNLGSQLSDLGQREDALKATQEAVDIYRKLAEKRPDAFLPNIALSLNNLGSQLSDLGQREDALKATQEAVDIYRKLAEKRPDAFLPDLASSLTNLGSDLSDLGQREDALKATQEAVDIYRKLAEKRPDAFLPQLATSLNNLGSDLSDLGQREDALKATQEAVDIYRKLAEKRPDAFLPDLAMSLNNLGGLWLSALGQREDALKAATESVELITQSFLIYPEAFAQDIAKYARNLTKSLQENEVTPESSPTLLKAQEAMAQHPNLFDTPND